MSEFKSNNLSQQPQEPVADPVVNSLQKTLDVIKDQLEVTDSRVGEFLIYKKDQVISQAIKLFGEYCHAEVTLMSRYLTENSCMLDIGTNIGYHAVGVHKETKCQVVGFEPNPKHFAVASYNARGLEKIQIVNGAASNKKQTFFMKDFDPSVESNYGDIHKTDTDGQIEVQAITVDSLTLNRCQFMKIDVEGHELEALEGSKKTISKFRPAIMFEAMEWDVWTACYNFLEERKYKHYWVACRTKPVDETYKKTDVNPFGNSTVSNILAVPAEREQPNDLLPVVNYEGFSSCFDRYRKFKVLF